MSQTHSLSLSRGAAEAAGFDPANEKTYSTDFRFSQINSPGRGSRGFDPAKPIDELSIEPDYPAVRLRRPCIAALGRRGPDGPIGFRGDRDRENGRLLLGHQTERLPRRRPLSIIDVAGDQAAIETALRDLR
jgi:hypothetical protein